MPDQAKPEYICPYLGLSSDRDLRFSYPEAGHLCYAADRAAPIRLDHQSAFCLTSQHSACPRFVEFSPQRRQVQPPIRDRAKTESGRRKLSLARKIMLWSLALVSIAALVVLGLYYYNSLTFPEPPVVVLNSTATPSPTAPVEEVVEATPIPTPIAVLPAPTATATPLPDTRIYTLSPAMSDVGWLVSNEERGNHFGDSYLYAGVFEGQIYQGAFQFDLSSIPRGAPIEHASIQLTGLRDDQLARRNDRIGTGVWMLRLLDSDIDVNWRRNTYQDILNAPVLQTLSPILSEDDLAAGKTNIFELTPAQIKILEILIIERENPTVSFRIDGPLVGPDNLFAWDTGYGPRSQGNKVSLILNVGEPPPTPPPFAYIVITSTPTPENVATAAQIVLQMTADATAFGTATPLPTNMVTPTPIPDYLVIVPTPVPENWATEQAISMLATAYALTTGTPLPIPTNAVTATPTSTPSSTPVPIPPNYVLITSTPTPESIFTAATMSAEATLRAQQFGPATPLPSNWVTPIVVTATPTPMNAATAEALQALAAAVALTTGTPTPIPSNMVTATATPVFEVIIALVTPTPTELPTPTPAAIPSSLLGKILFRSDREGDQPEDQGGKPQNVYVFDPETGQVGKLTNDWSYLASRERNMYSADTVYQTYNKQLLWTNVEQNNRLVPTEVLAIHYYDHKYQTEQIVTRMGAGIVYDPVWSPVSNEIAFVATESGNDEIWVINYDGTQARQLTRNTWEWDKSPSWSPDGSQIVFTSNRSGNQQLWIMNADGSEQRPLMEWTPYNDWGPVWVIYPDPPPLPGQPR